MKFIKRIVGILYAISGIMFIIIFNHFSFCFLGSDICFSAWIVGAIPIVGGFLLTFTNYGNDASGMDITKMIFSLIVGWAILAMIGEIS